MSTCPAKHPEHGTVCEHPESLAHPSHRGMRYVDHRPQMVLWDNVDYVAPPVAPKTRPERKAVLGGKVREVAEQDKRQMQEALDAPGAFLSHDPLPTSAKAADLSKVRNSQRRQQVLAAVVALGGNATDDEVCVRLNDPNVHAGRVASRRAELVEGAWLEPLLVEGRWVERSTRANGDGKVWTLTASARHMLTEIDLPSLP